MHLKLKQHSVLNCSTSTAPSAAASWLVSKCFENKVMGFKCFCSSISLLGKEMLCGGEEGRLTCHIWDFTELKAGSLSVSAKPPFFPPFVFCYTKRTSSPIVGPAWKRCRRRSRVLLGFPPLGESVRILYSSLVRGFLLSLMI